MTDRKSRIEAIWSHDSITLQDSQTGQKILKNFEPVISVVISPDSETAAAHSKTAITLWDIETGEETLRYNKMDKQMEILTEDYFVDIEFSPSGQLVASWNDHGIISVWQAENGHELCLLGRGSDQIINRRNRQQYKQEDPIKSIAFSSDDQFLAAGDERGLTRVWDLTKGQMPLELSGPYREVWSVAFSPNGKILAAAYEFGPVKCWDREDGKERHTFPADPGVSYVKFLNDEKLESRADGRVETWNVCLVEAEPLNTRD